MHPAGDAAVPHLPLIPPVLAGWLVAGRMLRPLRTLAVAYHVAGQEEVAARLAVQALAVAQAAI